ncbi:hypothetical protein NPIL_631841 [Nephila pilipes]|uniref:Uncharacterized protein n=1 Tax=Nephila pilipes TaxID=299642 RepID=A0A8X6PB07_NEPPI|nr:hypothetical protein NPIL_631841 [Nephila pilipes]
MMSVYFADNGDQELDWTVRSPPPESHIVTVGSISSTEIEATTSEIFDRTDRYSSAIMVWNSCCNILVALGHSSSLSDSSYFGKRWPNLVLVLDLPEGGK